MNLNEKIDVKKTKQQINQSIKLFIVKYELGEPITIPFKESAIFKIKKN